MAMFAYVRCVGHTAPSPPQARTLPTACLTSSPRCTTAFIAAAAGPRRTRRPCPTTRGGCWASTRSRRVAYRACRCGFFFRRRPALAQHITITRARSLPPVSPQSAAKLVRTLCYTNKDRLLAGIIVAGWDAANGGRCATGRGGAALRRFCVSLSHSRSLVYPPPPSRASLSLLQRVRDPAGRLVRAAKGGHRRLGQLVHLWLGRQHVPGRCVAAWGCYGGAGGCSAPSHRSRNPF